MATKKAKTSDELAQELFNKVQIRKAELENAEKLNWQTSGLFGFNADTANGRFQIQTMTDTRKITDILTFLLERARSYNEATAILGLNLNFSWLGYTLEEWTTDLKTRVTILQKETKRKELQAMETKLNNLISPELKAKLELAELEKALAD